VSVGGAWDELGVLVAAGAGDDPWPGVGGGAMMMEINYSILCPSQKSLTFVQYF